MNLYRNTSALNKVPLDTPGDCRPPQALAVYLWALCSSTLALPTSSDATRAVPLGTLTQPAVHKVPVTQALNELSRASGTEVGRKEVPSGGPTSLGATDKGLGSQNCTHPQPRAERCSRFWSLHILSLLPHPLKPTEKQSLQEGDSWEPKMATSCATG